ncbi:hypothetical protein NKG05_05900 [Oerskovia sp. M15]
MTLARTADATVFGTGDPSPHDVDAYWTEVDSVLDGMRSALPRRHRVRAALSLRSLRGARPSWLPAWVRSPRSSDRQPTRPSAGSVPKPGDT